MIIGRNRGTHVWGFWMMGARIVIIVATLALLAASTDAVTATCGTSDTCTGCLSRGRSLRCVWCSLPASATNGTSGECIPVNTDGTTRCPSSYDIATGTCPPSSSSSPNSNDDSSNSDSFFGVGLPDGESPGLTHGYVGVFAMLILLLSWKLCASRACLSLGPSSSSSSSPSAKSENGDAGAAEHGGVGGGSKAFLLHAVRDSVRHRVLARALRLRRRVRAGEDGNEHAVLDPHAPNPEDVALEVLGQEDGVGDDDMLTAHTILTPHRKRERAPRLHSHSSYETVGLASYYSSQEDTYEFLSS